MAVSKKRDKDVYKAPRNIGKPKDVNPKWLVPTATGLLIFGLLWIVVYYVFKAQYPLPIGDWNLAVGFAFMIGSMMLFTRWK